MARSTAFRAVGIVALRIACVVALSEDCAGSVGGSGDTHACQATLAPRHARLDESSLLQVSATLEQGGPRAETPAVAAVSMVQVESADAARQSDASIRASLHVMASTGYMVVFVIILLFVGFALYWVITSNSADGSGFRNSPRLLGAKPGSPRLRTAQASNMRSPGMTTKIAGPNVAANSSPSSYMVGEYRPLTQAIMMSPQLSWATVPSSNKLLLVVPALSSAGTANQETSFKFNVGTKDGTEMISLSYLRHKTDAQEFAVNGASEYITLALPEDESQDFVMCALGRPAGPMSPLEAHIYMFGKTFYGTLRQDPGQPTYTLSLANHQPCITAIPQGPLGSRKVSIVRSEARDQMVALADQTGKTYEVQCFPLSDVLLIISMLTCMDRLSVLTA